MGRILAIDYGKVRTGLAVTDPLKIIATALDTIATDSLFEYLKQYTDTEEVELFVLGLPIGMKSQTTDTTEMVQEFQDKLQLQFPHIPIKLIDERFTSKMAFDAMIASGTSKKNRRQKGNVDKIAAVIILQSYMEQQGSAY